MSSSHAVVGLVKRCQAGRATGVRESQALVAILSTQLWYQEFHSHRTDVQLTETDAMLERGIIDSMGVLELISFVQDEFGIKVRDDEITEENFGTLAGIANYVLGKRAAMAAS